MGIQINQEIKLPFKYFNKVILIIKEEWGIIVGRFYRIASVVVAREPILRCGCPWYRYDFH